MVGLALALFWIRASSLDTVSGQSTITRVVSPTSWSVGGGDIEVQIRIENVANLAVYEWQLSFDPALLEFKGATNSALLGSTGRTVNCRPPIVGPAYGQGVEGGSVLILAEGNVRFACATAGLPPPDGTAPPGASGSGLLSTVTLLAVAEGTANLDLAWVSLGDPNADDIPSQRQGSCVAIGVGASCVSPTVAPPASPTPPVTPTPGGLPSPTPTGPVPTPTPLPPGTEAVALVAGCNPVTSTYPDGTPIQTFANAVGPAGNLVSLWEFEVGVWRAFSPQYPQASDLTAADMLDVVFACVAGPGAFVRPII